MEDEYFEEYFEEYLNSPKTFETKLDNYWHHGNLDKYYFLQKQCKKNGFRIIRNSDGKHKLEKRWD